MTLTVLSLFAGIGGIDLGLERAGMRTGALATLDPAAHGLPGGLAGRRISRWRRAALKAIGNAVVPQVVELVGRAILAADAALRGEAASEVVA